ncbi:MAG TPA: DMT family transporter [Acidimicrobiales bacterium]|nr:DMT family transporter [Acidimicrobiales bacterium]
MLAGGLALALASALVLNASFFVQHSAAATAPPLSLRRPVASLQALFGNLGWLAGWLAGWVGWGLYIAALALAPLSLVQAVAAGGVGVLALLAQRVGQARLSRAEWAGVVLAMGGLVDVLAGAPQGGRAAAGTAGRVDLALGVVVAAALVVLAAGPVLRPGAGLGGAAGLFYAAGDVATKGALAGRGVALVAVVAACHGAGFVALQLGFQRGSVLATAGMSSILNNAVPIAAGLFLFGESLPRGPAGAARLGGFVAVSVGAALLARSPSPGSPEQT